MSQDLPACPQDEDVAEYVLGSLEAVRRGDIEVHIDTCVSCRKTVSALALSLTGVAQSPLPNNSSDTDSPLGPGSQVGRYVVLHLVGAGQMGQVYLAYDPALDRNVALKFVHEAGDAKQLRARFQSEARVMAKLAHANLVAIHDVGIWQSQIFLAMEFVEGQTLGDWREAKPRSWPEIRRVMIEAGRGLAAAHRAGIVHRDFKPENILLGKDGRVLVADFGLAFRDHDTSDESSRENQNVQATRPGSGTPAYMAPEQFAGDLASERSDQFSYCAVLFECLCGTRPFAGDSFVELAKHVRSGQTRVFRPTVKGAMRVKSVVLRGLSVEPRDRLASVEDVVALLQRDAGRRARVATWSISLAAIAIIGALVFFRNMPVESPSPCASSTRKFSETWNTVRKGQLRGEFAKHANGLATYERMARVLNAYASDWSAARSDACESTHLRHEQSERVLDLRMQCLDRRQADFGALVNVYSSGSEPADLRFAVEASFGLAQVSDCANPELLTLVTPMPPDKKQRDAIAELNNDVSRLHTLRLAGRYSEALRLAETLAPAVKTAAYAPLNASYSYEYGMLLSIDRQDEEALRVARVAVQTAAKAKDDRLSAESWILVARISGVDLQQHDKPSERLAAARAAVTRTGNQIELLAELEHVEGTILWRAGDKEEAEKHAAKAQALTLKALGPTVPRYAQAIHNHGLILADLGKFKAAEKLYQEALEVWTSSLGPRHAQVASVLNSLGTLHGRLGEYDRAEPYLRKSLSINEEVFGADHVSLASALTNLGSLAKLGGDYETALGDLNRALTLRESSLGPTHVALATTLANLASVCLDLDRYNEALAYADRAIGIREESQGLDHPGLVYALQHRGKALRNLGNLAEARRALVRSLRIARLHYPKENKIVLDLAALVSSFEGQSNRSAKVGK